MPQILRLAVTGLANHSGPLERAWAVVGFFRAGADLNVSTHLACCEAAASLAEKLGVGPRVSRALKEVFTRWDGKVFPLGAGESISLIARLSHLIRVAHVHSIHRGPAAAAAVVRKWRGGEHDPTVRDGLLNVYPERLAIIGESSV